MHKFPSLKSAIGFYANFRKGPQVAQQKLAPRVQESTGAGADEWISMAGAIARVRHRQGVGLEVLMRWATTADGVHSIDGKLGAALSDLRQELEQAGLVEPRTKPIECEDHEWVDLNTGRKYRSKRAK